MKLSVNKAKLSGLRARNCVTSQQVLSLKKLPPGPKSYRAFRETGPWTILVILHFLWIVRMNKITLRCTMPLMGELKKIIMRRAYSKPTKRNRNVHFKFYMSNN